MSLIYTLAVQCDELPDIHENARILSPNGTSFGARAEITCAPGFRPNGARFITCLVSGQWSDSLSPCVRGMYIDRAKILILIVLLCHRYV